MSIEHIATAAAPAAIGPYSQAVRAGGFLFISGQLGIVPETGPVSYTHLTLPTNREV